MNKKCTVCFAEGSKYKCAACKAQSCSLSCFKTHSAQCATFQDQTVQPVDSTTITQGVTFQPTVDQRNHPSREEINELFKNHPTLKAQLRDIYRATQQPEARDEHKGSHRNIFDGRGRGRGSYPSTGAYQPRWDPEKGFDHGLKQLERALEQDPGKNEALQIFVGMALQQQGENEQRSA